MSTTSLAVDVNALRRDFETLKRSERSRQDFFQTLIDQVRDLNLERERHAKALRASELLANTYQDRFESAEKQISDLQRAIDCDAFILILIDGDNTLFQDGYVKGCIQGGERASRDLRQTLFDFLKDKDYFKHDSRIVTKIFLNLAGLSKTYCDAKITSNPDSFHHFIQGFNKTHLFSEIIDAGNGKEAADNKIKAEFELFQRNLHCKQIVLASSGDNSYGGLLRQHAPSVGKSEKITLIEALPFAQELRLLTDSFETVRFKNVFRNTKITGRPPPVDESKNRMRTPSFTSDITFESFTPSLAAQASAFNTPVTGTQLKKDNSVPTASPPVMDTIPTNLLSSLIHINHLDQRIDEDLSVEKSLFNAIKKFKFCNKYHIAKTCNGNCGHKHGPQLRADEYNALRCVARLKPCDKGLKCRDPKCFDGHRCLAGSTCERRARGACWFSNDMHGVDLRNIRVIFA